MSKQKEAFWDFEMPKQKIKLMKKLETLPDITLEQWKDTELIGVLYKGKEVAHFQTGEENELELDIRLTPKLIKEEKLTVPENSKSHPTRSKNSRWIVQSFASTNDFEKIIRLIGLASELHSDLKS